MSLNYHDYESYGVLSELPEQVELLEAFSGQSIVAWYGNIERQIGSMIQRYEAGRNFQYADKLRAFLTTWRDNVITGSINREVLDPIQSAANMLSVDGWKLSNYFSNLRDQVRKLVASEEELPRTGEPVQPSAPSGAPMGGMPAGGPPADFGPEATPPGQPGAPEQPPAPGQAPAPGAPGQPNPDEDPTKVTV